MYEYDCCVVKHITPLITYSKETLTIYVYTTYIASSFLASFRFKSSHKLRIANETASKEDQSCINCCVMLCVLYTHSC